MDFLSLSKLFWFVAEPSSLLMTLWLLGTLLLWTSWRRLGRLIVTATVLFVLAVAMLPIGQWVLKPIEDRFPPPITLPPRVDGIIVLGGVIDDQVIGKRGIPPSLSATGSRRLDAFIELAKRYPLARHVFTGGAIELIDGRDTEADIVRRIFARIGLDTTHIIFEDRSRNTWENAAYSFGLVKPAPEELWILITSARHMPRAVGAFRRAGWMNLLAFPTDFATDASFAFQPNFGLGSDLHFLNEAVREYVGLVVYYYLKRTDDLFPAP
ncbi:MAG: YdcF family protein [Proteobacteria bacterium]|nr:YdcF family protein [Pseudomonadota bacterium]